MTSQRILSLMLLALLTMASAGCELVGDIFQAGMFVGVLAVVVVLAVVGWLVSRLF